jgi:hypothetical protein
MQAATTLAIVAGAAAVAASAAIHLHLWLAGYRHIHLIGPAFLAQVIIGVGIALGLVSYRRLGTIVAGALYSAGSAAALLLSATVGFLGLHDGLGVPWAAASLIIELAGLVLLAAATSMLLWWHRAG